MRSMHGQSFTNMQHKRMTTPCIGCATCKRRAISCDGAKPHCTNCSRSNRKCHGYGLKLSWPRANDGRRAVVSKSPQPYLSLPSTGLISDARFVHMSHWDIELNHSLTNSAPVRTLSLLGVPMLCTTFKLEAPDRDLFEYFCCVASAALATFGHDAITLGKILVRIALEMETASVLQALLAFASLHRYGLQPQAVELKVAALRSLAKGSAAVSLGAKETVQHTATGMLLCSFEVHQSSCSSDEWMGFLRGVETVINASSIEELLQFGSDVVILLDWVHYYDVLARFSLQYWEREGTPELPSTATNFLSSKISMLPPPIFSMLNLLSQSCAAGSATQPETSDSFDDYKDFLKVTDWRIRTIPMPKSPDNDSPVLDDATLMMHLYQLAMLVFINRRSEGVIEHPTRTQQYIDEAFSIFSRLRFCKQQFPIHVIGCEARTDEQRAVILDVISRTEKMSLSRSFNFCKRILQAVWAQYDLQDGNKIRYGDMLTSVISHCMIVPAFV